MEYEGSLYQRELDDGRIIVVYPMLFTARLCIGPSDSPCYADAWCFNDPISAIIAAAQWDGDGDPPDGWHRHIGSGRRRTDGDPAKEYIHE